MVEKQLQAAGNDVGEMRVIKKTQAVNTRAQVAVIETQRGLWFPEPGTRVVTFCPDPEPERGAQ